MTQVQIPALPLRTVGCQVTSPLGARVPIDKTGQRPLPQDKRRLRAHCAPSQCPLNSSALQLTRCGSGSARGALAWAPPRLQVLTR